MQIMHITRYLEAHGGIYSSQTYLIHSVQSNQREWSAEARLL